MASWMQISVGDLGDLFDGPHATPERTSDGPYFLNIASLKSGRLDLSESDHLNRQDFKVWTRRVTPRCDDLLFSYETRLGEAALMPAGVEACLGRRMALLRPNPAVVNPRFLLYFYLSPLFQRTIAKHTVHGATVPRIGLSTMPGWSVKLPGLTEQRAIAEVLGALDDKIAANERVSHASEAVVVALVESTSETTVVAELATQSTQSVRPHSFDTKVFHFSLPSFDDGGRPDLAAASSIKSNKFLIERPAVLISKLNPRITRVWDVVKLPDQVALASTEFVILHPMDLSTTALCGALRQPAVTAALAGKVAGTSGSHQRVKPAEVLQLRVPDPRSLGPGVLQLIESVGRSIHAVREECAQLAATRDELLPLLMSGRLRVKDAEKVVAEVV
jgi:type I restriction enzyme S subunit